MATSICMTCGGWGTIPNGTPKPDECPCCAGSGQMEVDVLSVVSRMVATPATPVAVPTATVYRYQMADDAFPGTDRAALVAALQVLAPSARKRLRRLVGQDRANVYFPAGDTSRVTIWVDNPGHPEADMRMTPEQFSGWCETHPEE